MCSPTFDDDALEERYVSNGGMDDDEREVKCTFDSGPTRVSMCAYLLSVAMAS